MRNRFFAILLLSFCIHFSSAQTYNGYGWKKGPNISNEKAVYKKYADNGTWVGFFDGNYNKTQSIGIQEAAKYNCAIRLGINDQSLNTKRICALRFGLTDLKNIDQVKVWMSTKIPASPEDADICCESIDNSKLFDLVNDGKSNDFYFTIPHQMLRKDIFIGYSFNVKKCESDMDKYPVVTSGDFTYSGTLFIQINDQAWQDLSGSNFGLLAVMINIDDDAPFIKGDVNYDDIVNITDIAAISKYISGRKIDYFNKKAADIDNNHKINVVDLASAVDIVLERYNPTSKSNDVIESDIMVSKQTESGTEIMIDGNGRYRALQMDVTLPGNDIMAMIEPGDALKDKYTIDINRIFDNKVRITAVSLDGKYFTPDEGSLLIIKNNFKELNIENIIFATDGLYEKIFEYSADNNATGINKIINDCNVSPIYTLQGIKVGNERKTLAKGIYIIDGKKVVIK